MVRSHLDGSGVGLEGSTGVNGGRGRLVGGGGDAGVDGGDESTVEGGEGVSDVVDAGLVPEGLLVGADGGLDGQGGVDLVQQADGDGVLVGGAEVLSWF